MSFGRCRSWSRAMPKSVCIIGAGPSGLVAAKTFLHNAPRGEFKVCVYESQDAIGGLWPASKADAARQVHPLMVANQSKHTMQFSDLAWQQGVPELPRAWMVGQYLQRYYDRYLAGHEGFELQLKSRVLRAEQKKKKTEGENGDGSSAGWRVSVESKDNGSSSGESGSISREFDYLLVASGYFGKPAIPDCFKQPLMKTSVPVIHSSQYRDLKGLLGKNPRGKGKILVVGGQMSGVEIAGTIATHLSSAINSPEEFEVPNIDKYSLYHVIQRPIWVLPLFTTPEPNFPAPPFLPLDYTYSLNNRAHPLINNQGHITEQDAQKAHGLFEASLGTDQSEFCPLLTPNDEAKKQPSYLAVSDWYCDFVRAGTITLSLGKVASLEGNIATLVRGGSKMDDVAAVVLATGFDPCPSLDYLSEEILKTLQHSPEHPELAYALAFHGTHHPEVQNLGFVGFYRSPYWGVMQMQARFLAKLWSSPSNDTAGTGNNNLPRKLEADDSIKRTLDLRGDPGLSQFPMGDYLYLMQEFSEALSIELQPPLLDSIPTLSHNDLPLDMLTPSRYPSTGDDDQAKLDAMTSLKETRDVAVDGLTTPRFVSRAVFRSLLGTWYLDRDLKSRLPSHPSGRFVGTATFLLRDTTSDGIQCAAGSNSTTANTNNNSNKENGSTEISGTDDLGMEYLYIEEGDFTADNGFTFKATRRYIWRYDEMTEKLSVWFVKPDDQKRADYLFHKIEFVQPESRQQAKGWPAKAGHLCIDDYYDVKYNFAFKAVNLKDWNIEYTVNGPKKDYTIRGTYTR